MKQKVCSNQEVSGNPEVLRNQTVSENPEVLRNQEVSRKPEVSRNQTVSENQKVWNMGTVLKKAAVLRQHRKIRSAKVFTLLMASVIIMISLMGCGNTAAGSGTAQVLEETTASTAAVQTAPEEDTIADAQIETTQNGTDENKTQENITESNGMEIKIGALKGATTIGLASLMAKSQEGETMNQYKVTMETAADTLLPLMIKGELDIALLPANVASVLYHKTDGGITVIDINTLGVLYMVSADDDFKEMSDLAGKTIYLTGRGTTPDYVLQYLLKENGLSDKVTLEYRAEATEVAAILAAEENSIGLLPQPFVTAAMTQNEDLKIIFDCTKEWKKLQGEEGSSLVTGVTVVRNEFLTEHREAVDSFLREHADSANKANEDIQAVAEMVEKLGIIEKAAIAEKAIPYCNITCITGEEMKQALSGYFTVLHQQNPESIGGELPGEDFYYNADKAVEKER